MKTIEIFGTTIISMDINERNIIFYLDYGVTNHITKNSSKIFELKIIRYFNIY